MCIFHALKELVRKLTQRFGDGTFLELEIMDKLTPLLVLGFLVLATARHYDDGKEIVVRNLRRYESSNSFFRQF